MTADHVESGVAAAGEVFLAAGLVNRPGEITNANRHQLAQTDQAARNRIMQSDLGRFNMHPTKAEQARRRLESAKAARNARACMHREGCPKLAGYAGLPFCKEHAYDALAKLDRNAAFWDAEERLQEQVRRDRETASAFYDDFRAKVFEERNRTQFDGTSPGVVYYLQVGELIKIGWTADLSQRLKSYPPDAILLATHPGTLDTEKSMHQKFAHLLSGRREWFKDDKVVRDHIAKVVRDFGEPKSRVKMPAPSSPGAARRI